MFWKYPNLMKALGKIELGEVPCISNSVKHLIDSWCGVLVHHCELVDGAVIHQHTKLHVTLGTNNIPEP